MLTWNKETKKKSHEKPLSGQMHRLSDDWRWMMAGKQGGAGGPLCRRGARP